MLDLTKKEFKVGDIIVVKNWAGTHSLTVTRLTKLQPFANTSVKTEQVSLLNIRNTMT